MVTCFLCDRQCVGQTCKMPRGRFCSHCNTLKHQDQSNALVKHFDKYHTWRNYPDERFSDFFYFTPIEKIPIEASFQETK